MKNNLYTRNDIYSIHYINNDILLVDLNLGDYDEDHPDSLKSRESFWILNIDSLRGFDSNTLEDIIIYL